MILLRTKVSWSIGNFQLMKTYSASRHDNLSKISQCTIMHHQMALRNYMNFQIASPRYLDEGNFYLTLARDRSHRTDISCQVLSTLMSESFISNRLEIETLNRYMVDGDP